ncbi:homoserine kinase [Marinitenerispora sediminis]|uniref:Homoserine kinase n=1 Tax=Marinitenerispora sediminis TaxID=1931232 RepID=A0A368T488_9ACTN|nr:homoserine kinase [Marinitenerispora sediminis]RCV56177.1 homoserine kinase [Marinitenerispora sediminis]RCV57497.1 homoserine kinase [Marinitenerispora sediminis]RCV57852.1 homoserine kinase [Marinitenerispora sediminis]
MPQTRRSAVHVRTPATSANLGPGFDALGLALALHDEVTVRVRDDDRVTVRVEGEGAGELPADASHLVVRAARAAFEAAGERPPGLDLHCRNRIPHGRGLGSSASAIVAGVSAATALLGGDPAAGDRDRVFELAADIEGHPDNVAPCVYGGFTVAWRGAGGWRALSMAASPLLRPVACVPDQRLSTERARGLLPPTVPHADAAFTAGRAALLVAAVTARPELLLEATEDRLHESYRAAAMPASAELVRRLRERDGVPAVISGAGPTVLVLGRAPETGSPGAEGGAAPDLTQISAGPADSIGERAGTGWHIRPLRIDPAGVCISSPRS